MKRILLFVVMCALTVVQIKATITISPDPNPYNQTWIGNEQISNFKIFTISGWDSPGDVAKLLNGDPSLSVNWNGKSLSDLTGAIIIHLGAGANTDLLSDDDLQALNLLTSTKYLDLDGSSLAEGASINNIQIGSAVEGVVLPDGLSKDQVNGVATILSASENFGSCISKNTVFTVSPVTNYYYTEGNNSGQKVVESNTVVLDKANLKATVKEDVTVDLALKEGYPKYKFTNPYTYSDVIINDPGNISNGQYTPATLEVNVTETKTYTYNGNPVQGWAVEERDGKYYMQSWATESNGGAPGGVEVQASVTYTYSYNGQTYPYTLDEDHPVVNGVGTIDNTESFSVTQEYLYTYELDNQTVELPVQNSPDDDMKYTAQHDVIYSVEAREEEETTSEDNVIAYVNKAGSLYKSTHVAPVSYNLSSVVISGNVNNGDIAVNQNATDPNGSKNDSDKFTNTAVAAFYMNSKSCSIKSFDIGDSNIEDYKYLRVLDAFGESLESVVFPKTVTRIPNYCCFSSKNAVKNLANVVFPTEASSFTIGDYAFHGIALNSLLLPSSVTQVGDYAFATCPNLYDVEMEGLNATCHFGNNVFEQCSALQHVTLSEKVENIGDYMFNQCGLLESIRIPGTCKTIGSCAFQYCFSIHQVTIPEGVELIKLNAFEGAGLTDLYIMATSIDKLPKIYAMSPTGDGPSSFSYQRTTGNNTTPQSHRDDIANAEYDEVMTWYQEEQSGAEGLGTGNCLTALHYPENMKPFYEALDVTKFYSEAELATIPMQTMVSGAKKYYKPDEYLALITDDQRRAYVQLELENKKQDGTDPAYNFGTDENGNPILYQYIPQAYAIDAFPTGHNNDRPIGPDASGLFYPNQHDYWIRMAAGATGTQSGGVGGQEVASAWGWRQFPLATSIESIGETPFEKEYDDTWYTMCFPWRMIDNQLFSAFNQKCEIVEFVGAEVLPVEGSETDFNLVFHFDNVAVTAYMDHNDVEYSRERDGNRVDGAGHNLYIYTNKTDPTDIVRAPDPLPDKNTTDEAVKEQYGRYLTIQNILVRAGHPYMIHPSIGAAPGVPAKVYINGVKKVEVGEGKAFADYDALAEANKSVRTVSSKTRSVTKDADGNVIATNYEGVEEWKNPVTGKGGKYTFIGNIKDEVTTGEGESAVSDGGKKDLPQGCYYLGLPDGTVYPKYFRRKSVGTNLWSQYSAIILPDADAVANVEGLNGMTVKKPNGTNAKGATMTIGEWDFDEMSIVDENGIATIIDEAIEKDSKSEVIRMNVVYNIKGQVVRADSGSVVGLPKGIYIVNGKKYMVK